MNELLFFAHTLLVIALTLGALRLGREALVVAVALMAVIANLFVLKQIQLFGLTVTCADVYIVGAMIGLNLIQEFFGKELVRRTTWVTLGAMTLFALMAQLHLLYRPAPVDGAQVHYLALLSVAPRLLAASFFCIFLVQRLGVRLFGILQRTSLPLAIRSGCTQAVCQAVDTGLFAVLGLWGIVAHLGHVMVASFLVKMGVILLMAPLTGLGRRVAV